MSIPAVELLDASTGSVPRMRTRVRAGVRGGELLVRFDGRDDGVVATLRRRDEPLWTEDVYEVFLSPVDPPTLYYEFEINPLGALFDARVSSPDLGRATMNVDVAWNLAGLRGTSRVRTGHWSSVLRIPLGPMVSDVNALTPALRPPASRETRPSVAAGTFGRRGETPHTLPRGEREQTLPRLWRANFYRVDLGSEDEYSAWSPTGRTPADFHEPSRFGRLRMPI